MELRIQVSSSEVDESPDIQSEVSQKEEKNIIHEHIYMESRKTVLMNLLQGRNRDSDTEKDF